MNEDNTNRSHLKPFQEFLLSLQDLDAHKTLNILHALKFNQEKWQSFSLLEYLLPFIGERDDDGNNQSMILTPQGLRFAKKILPLCFEKGYNPLHDVKFENLFPYTNTPFYLLLAELCTKNNTRNALGSGFYYLITTRSSLPRGVFQGIEHCDVNDTHLNGNTLLHGIFQSDWIWGTISKGYKTDDIMEAFSILKRHGAKWDILNDQGETALDLAQHTFNSYVSYQKSNPKIEEFLSQCLKEQLTLNTEQFLAYKQSLAVKKM